MNSHQPAPRHSGTTGYRQSLMHRISNTTRISTRSFVAVNSFPNDGRHEQTYARGEKYPAREQKLTPKGFRIRKLTQGARQWRDPRAKTPRERTGPNTPKQARVSQTMGERRRRRAGRHDRPLPQNVAERTVHPRRTTKPQSQPQSQDAQAQSVCRRQRNDRPRSHRQDRRELP